MKRMRFMKICSLIALISALMLAFGCSNDKKDHLADPMEQEIQMEPGPIGKYKTPLQISVWAGINDIMQFAEGESIDDNLHTRFMKDFLNIEFTNKWVADGAKINEKVNLDIASNDLPDAIQVTLDQLSKLMKNDQIEDLTAVWNEYASDGLKENMGYQNNVSFIPASREGKIYGIPLPYDMGNSISLMYIRKDWLENLGLKPPRTLDELMIVAKAFVEDDPDGNGKKDTYAIAAEKGNDVAGPAGYPATYVFDSIAAAYKAYPGLWLKDETSGRIVYGSMQSQMKKALSHLQQLYKMGAVDPKFAVMDLPKVGKSIGEGQYGIVFGPFYYPMWPLKDSRVNNAIADWEVMPIPSLDGSKVVPKALPFVNNWIVVRKGYKHPEAIIKAMNITHMMQANIGEPGKFWLKSGRERHRDMSAHLYMKPYTFDSPIRNMESGKQIKAALDNKDESYLKSPSAQDIYKNYIMMPDPISSWVYTKVFYDSQYKLSQYDKLQYSIFFDSPTPEMQSKGAALKKIEYAAFLKIIMGAPLEEFDKFVDEWMRLGGSQITQEVNEWVAQR